MSPDTNPPGASDRIEGQLDVFEVIEIAETGADGHPTTEQLNCPHCECAALLEYCCICGANWDDDDDRG